MALQVWLPLTKDTRNQGLLNGTINWTTAASFTNNGKLGKALSTGGCTMPASMTSQVLNNKAVTIACWLYVNADADDTTNRAMIFGNDSMSALGGRQFSIFRYPNADDIHLSWQNCIDGKYTTIIGGTWPGVLTPHAWNHICVTYDNPTAKIYVNGTQVGTASGNINTDSYSFDTHLIWNSSSHYINDFRIYDHCLSQMEIKELSKGLILHYPLNRGGWGQENLVTNSSSEWSAWYTPSVNGTNQTSNPGTATLPASKSVGDIYSCSVEIEFSGVSTGSGGTFAFRAQGSSTSGWVGGNPWSNLFFSGTVPADGIYRYNWTGSITSASVNDTTFNCGFRADYWGGGKYRVRLIKMEPGEISTPWCPHSTQVAYTTMGLNGTTEYDCSGYCNNGTRTGTFEWTSDTPKYSVSQYFNGSSYIKTLPGEFPWSNYDNLTIAAWMKPTATPSSWTGSIGIAHDSGAGNKIFAISNYGGKFTVHTANGNYVSTQSNYTCPLNEWHHYIATLSGTTVNMYVDGTLNKTYTIDWGTTTNHANPQIEVGVDLPGSDEKYTGYYSDVRIYAAALSADDVKSLYQNCATIDPDGTIRGQIRS